MSQAAELQSTLDILQSLHHVKLAGGTCMTISDGLLLEVDSVSASVWLLWDILITLDQEVSPPLKSSCYPFCSSTGPDDSYLEVSELCI